MNARITLHHFARAALALVLLVGQTTTAAAGSTAWCARTHATAEQYADTPGAVHGDAGEHAAPHDHAPDAPAAPGASACGVVMLAGSSPEAAGTDAEQVIRVPPTDSTRPTSQSPPPPYQPPRA